MSPPIHKDWWLAAALTSAALPTALGQTAAATDRRPAGIVTSVTQGAPVPGSSTPIYIESASGQRLTTGPGQTLHVLFSDQSAITVGPNSELVIADYKYDSRSKDGNLLVNMTKGLLRVVGGFISKKSETMVRTNTATIGIRGGITIVEHEGGQTMSNFLFGQSMRMSSNDGSQTETITRPGFGLSFDGNGLSPPRRIPPSDLTSQLQRLESRPPAPPPTPAPSAPPAAGSPGDTLANDRLKNAADSDLGADPSQRLRDILGNGQAVNTS